MTEGICFPNRINTLHNEIWLDEEGVLWVRALEMHEMDLDEAKACFDAYRQLLGEKCGVLQIVDARNSFTLTKEARDYVAAEGELLFTASAVISSSLPVRLMVNFLNQFYRNKVALKMFSSEKEARKWLHKFKK